jgi:thiol-disulfide isomerase/thioredoxin
MEKSIIESWTGRLLFIVLSILAGGQAQSQGGTPQPNENTYQSEKIANFSWERTYNYAKKELQLSDFEGKIVILDFWATTCGTCINTFPKLDSLQRRFGKDVQIILVDYFDLDNDPHPRVEKVFANTNRRLGHDFIIPTVLADSLARNTFPHKGIPHLVWLSRDRKVIANTYAEELTASNLQKVIDGKPVSLYQKKDSNIDVNKPLFPSAASAARALFSSVLAPFTEGVSRMKGFGYVDEQHIDRIFVINESIFNMYTFAYPQLLQYMPHRFILDVTDAQNYRNEKPDIQWQMEHTFTYELLLAPTTKALAIDMMRQDLDRYFGLKMKVERRTVPYWRIITYGKGPTKKADSAQRRPADNLNTSDTTAKFIQDKPLITLTSFLNQLYQLPVVDETGIKGFLDLNLPADLTDITAMQEMLKKQGLMLHKTTGPLEYMVLTDKH